VNGLPRRSRIGRVNSAEFDGIFGASDECQDVIRQDEEVREISSCLGAAKLGTENQPPDSQKNI
jgi:hypothetical protein